MYLKCEDLAVDHIIFSSHNLLRFFPSEINPNYTFKLMFAHAFFYIAFILLEKKNLFYIHCYLLIAHSSLFLIEIKVNCGLRLVMAD